MSARTMFKSFSNIDGTERASKKNSRKILGVSVFTRCGIFLRDLLFGIFRFSCLSVLMLEGCVDGIGSWDMGFGELGILVHRCAVAFRLEAFEDATIRGCNFNLGL